MKEEVCQSANLYRWGTVVFKTHKVSTASHGNCSARSASFEVIAGAPQEGLLRRLCGASRHARSRHLPITPLIPEFSGNLRPDVTAITGNTRALFRQPSSFNRLDTSSSSAQSLYSSRSFPVTLFTSSTGPVHARGQSAPRIEERAVRTGAYAENSPRTSRYLCPASAERDVISTNNACTANIVPYASRMDRAQRFRLLAMASSSKSSSSEPALTATFACLQSGCQASFTHT